MLSRKPIIEIIFSLLHIRAQETSRQVFVMRLELCDGLEPRLLRSIFIDLPNIAFSLLQPKGDGTIHNHI